MAHLRITDTLTEVFTLPQDAGSQVGKPARQRLALALSAAVLVVALGIGIAEVVTYRAQAGALPALSAGAVALVLLDCLATGLVEEVLLRGGVFGLLAWILRDRQRGVALAALLQAVLFALLHLTGAWPTAVTVTILVQAGAKVLAAFAFGLVMAVLYVLTRNLWLSIGVHAVYDMLSLAPQELLFGPITTYLTGTRSEAVIMVVTAIALLAIALVAFRRCFQQ